MNKTILAIVVLVVAIAGIGMLMPTEKTPVEETPTEQVVTMKTYTNERLGVSFEYPDIYVVTEKSGETGNPPRFDITVVNAKDYAEMASSTTPREGPLSMTITVFENGAQKFSLWDWIKKSDTSNWNISDGSYASTTIAGVEAVAYAWEGLYHGDTIAFVSNGTAYTASVTAMEPTDAIRADFGRVLQSLVIKPIAPVLN